MSAPRRAPQPSLIGALLGVAIAVVATIGAAHSVLTLPAPRDESDEHKDPDGPCGVPRAASQPVAPPFAPGSTTTVTWDETVVHPGCFAVDFSSADDDNWVTLASVAHEIVIKTPHQYSAQVTFPDEPCAACTLRVRQFMLSGDLPAAECPPANIGPGLTYYSCANVVLSGAPIDGGLAPPLEPRGGCTLALGGALGPVPSSTWFALALSFTVLRLRRRTGTVRVSS